MQGLPCRRVLYPYETRILLLLLDEEQTDAAHQIGEMLRETDMTIDGVFTVPAAHHIVSEFYHGLLPNASEEEEPVFDVEFNSDQLLTLLQKHVREGHCEACQELLPLMPAQLRHCPGCHTFAVAPSLQKKPDRESTEETQSLNHVAEYIIDTRTGLTNLHWLL